MDRHTIVFALDKRQQKLADILYGQKIICTWEEYERFSEREREKSIGEHIYVLPIAVTKLDKIPETKEKLKQELIKKKNNRDVIAVFGGLFNEEWKAFFKEWKIPYWDFMQLSEVQEGNGWITAEATVAEVLQLSPYSIWRQNVLITGYGCCGEKIAKVFSWLGANVTVVARRKRVRERAEKDGFFAIDFADIENYMKEIDTVINTVPSLVITSDIIKKMSKDMLIVDIASGSGGTDFETAKEFDITTRHALGLPGIYSTTSSAQLLEKAIVRYAPLHETIREDKSWIFQIVI